MCALSHLEEVGGAVHLMDQSQAKINTSQCNGIEAETVQGGLHYTLEYGTRVLQGVNM